ncbi:hypothetical protein [Streptomyces rimosus]|uniref:hypothetical protein n=1 Tax=Streptomyces rimosus TaxID=1927 RepID=UPI00131EC9C4|nr:hypothetical protein [Streptomyces rimosus]
MKAAKPRKEGNAADAYVMLPLEGPDLAVAWNATADRALTGHGDKLVLVAPDQDAARALVSELAVSGTWVGSPLAVEDAAHWRESRSDYPNAFIACIRYEGETAASEDVVRYRSLMRSLGQESVI